MTDLERFRELTGLFAELNQSLDLEGVLRDSLNAAVRLLRADTGSIALLDDARQELTFAQATGPAAERLKALRVPVGEGIVGYVVTSQEPVRVEDATQDPRFYSKVDEELGSRTGSYLSVPLVVDDVVIGTAQVLNFVTSRRFSADDEELFMGFASLMALAIRNARMHGIMLEKQAMETELDVCASIQANLLPQGQPTMAGLEIHGSSIPCRQVGGDYLTFVERPGGTLLVVLADVSGKGLPAALVVSELASGVHLLGQLEHGLGEIVTALNRHLTATLLRKQFVTLFAAELRPGETRFQYVLGGHPAPFLMSQGGERRRLAPGGPVLGMFELPFAAQEAELQPGELLLAFSDGYSEALSPDDEELDEEPLADLVTRWLAVPLADIQSRLASQLDAWRAGAPSADDDTLLLIRRPHEAGKGSS